MYGAILGDMVGSVYEWHNIKTKEFPLLVPRSCFTDDSAMTVAVAEALLDSLGKDPEERKQAVVRSMQKWGRKYPDAGYGGRFYNWLYARDPQPYGSWGNGSAMRVSSAGWLFDTLEETRQAARDTACVTHDHPEGLKGAEATAAVIWLARNGRGKAEIRQFVEKEFYPLKQTCDQIRPEYRFDVSCQGTVPQAITAFLEGNGFEDVIRTAVSLGGDCDTLTCIAGGMAEAVYGVPEDLKEACRQRLEPDMVKVLDRFEKHLKDRNHTHD
ncbi:MAG: ADP-ribosylglycohydrolase family protein [Clostridia bacterium]|nr:ADP-ribosylglycohydrolase family protein [Clostridia bacterium]